MDGNINYDWMKVLDYEELRKIRRKFWTFVIWPESGFDKNNAKDRHDFRNKIACGLGDMVVPSLISPIHDKDVKEDGTKAKPHCHVISLWENPQRYNVVLNIIQCGCGFNVQYIQPVANLRAMMRYLVHLDNPEKVQYDPTDVIEVAGAQYVLEDETASDNVTSYIVDNRCDSVTKLLSHYHASPSCKKWIISNFGLCKTLCKEQIDYVKSDYQQMREELRQEREAEKLVV